MAQRLLGTGPIRVIFPRISTFRVMSGFGCEAVYALIAGISRPRAASWLELEREISAVAQGEAGKAQ